MEYCCHIWGGAPSCYLGFLDTATKTYMQDCYGPSLAMASLEPLAHRRNVASLSEGCYKDVYVNSFFPHTTRPRNSLPIEHFPLIFSCFKSRINRHLLTIGSF